MNISRNPELKGSSFTLSVLHMFNNNIETVVDFLSQKSEQAPAFFLSAPIVINIEKVETYINFAALRAGILKAGMIPVGISGAKDKKMQKMALKAGFALMSSAKQMQDITTVQTSPVKVIRTPIRSGQQIYAENGDLVIFNHVSAGAEVIADGSIHIYGTMRGRAIAGAKGQKQAKIICHNLQAELISIAGCYWLSDRIDSQFWQQKVLISRCDDTLEIESLTF